MNAYEEVVLSHWNVKHFPHINSTEYIKTLATCICSPMEKIWLNCRRHVLAELQTTLGGHSSAEKLPAKP